jgi:hypothetical protein
MVTSNFISGKTVVWKPENVHANLTAFCYPRKAIPIISNMESTHWRGIQRIGYKEVQ